MTSPSTIPRARTCAMNEAAVARTSGLLLEIGVPFRQEAGGLLVEAQALNGLIFGPSTSNA